MQTGTIEHSNLEGGRIRVDHGGSTVLFRWRDTDLNPSEVGHGSRVEFRLTKSGKLAIGVRLWRD